MTMDDPLFVGRVETSAILSSVRDRLGHGERPRGDPIGERLSLDGTSWSTVGRDEALTASTFPVGKQEHEDSRQDQSGSGVVGAT
jgi:hypothetical protein